MQTLNHYPIQELKLIYNLLHAQLATHHALMDSELLQDLQNHLLQQAQTDGVDVGLHTDWAKWLTK